MSLSPHQCQVLAGFAGQEYVNSNGRAEFFGVSVRTNDRREQQGLLSGPDLVINHRRYWAVSTLRKDAQNLVARFGRRQAPTPALTPEEQKEASQA
jgi:hypothetical protein